MRLKFKLLLFILPLFLGLGFFLFNFIPKIIYAQATDCLNSAYPRYGGVLSTTNVNDSTRFKGLGKCVKDTPLAAIEDHKLITYDFLKNQYFTQIKFLNCSDPSNPNPCKEQISDFTNANFAKDTLSLISPQPSNLVTINSSPSGNGTHMFFIEGDLLFNPPLAQPEITYHENSANGGLIFVVKGDVFIAPQVTKITALIIAGGTICTHADLTGATPTCPSTPKENDETLEIIGSLTSLNKNTNNPIMFMRDRIFGAGGNKVPAEKVITDPKYLVLVSRLTKSSLTVTTEDTNKSANVSDPTACTGYIDADGDGFGIGSGPSDIKTGGFVNGICKLTITIRLDPSKYQDCNDTSDLEKPDTVVYRDADGDGYGLNNDQMLVCNQQITSFNNHPAGVLSYKAINGNLYVTRNNDCDDSNSDIYYLRDLYPDVDLDTVTKYDPVSVCAGAGNTPPSIPVGYQISRKLNILGNSDCNDADGTKWALIDLYRNNDGDRSSNNLACVTGNNKPYAPFAVESYPPLRDQCVGENANVTGYNTPGLTPTPTFPLPTSQSAVTYSKWKIYDPNTNTGDWVSDCNDDNASYCGPQPIYADIDGDGWGGSTSPGTRCFNDPNLSASTYVANSSDCDDSYALVAYNTSPGNSCTPKDWANSSNGGARYTWGLNCGFNCDQQISYSFNNQNNVGNTRRIRHVRLYNYPIGFRSTGQYKMRFYVNSCPAGYSCTTSGSNMYIEMPINVYGENRGFTYDDYYCGPNPYPEYSHDPNLNPTKILPCFGGDIYAWQVEVFYHEYCADDPYRDDECQGGDANNLDFNIAVYDIP